MLGRAAHLGQRVLQVALETHLPRPRLRLEAAHAGGHEHRHLRVLQLELERAGVDARELEQVVHEHRERTRLLAQSRQVLLGGGETILHRFEHRLDGRHGRAQVVAGPGDELAPRVEQLLEVGCHRVEGLGEVRELAGRIRGRAHLEGAG